MKYHFLFLVALSLVGCGGLKERHRPQVFTGVAMTVPYRILVGSSGDEETRLKLQSIISRTFAEIDEIYNKWNPLSEISKLNRAKAGELIPLSYPLAAFLLKVEEMVIMTDGRFDPTIEAVQNLWQALLNEEKAPSEKEITDLAAATGWHNIHIKNGFFLKDNDATQMDMGGIIKGYGIDQLIKNISEAGYANIFVEWGGEVSAKGNHPDGRRWNVFISNIDRKDPEKTIAHISLSNQALATSCGEIKSWQIGQERFSHIFDTLLLRPMEITGESITSASVLAPNCFLADGLATAALTFTNMAEAKAWADQLSKDRPDVAVWLIAKKGV